MDSLICNGSNIPRKLSVRNCVINMTNNILVWNINGTTVVQYDYVTEDLKKSPSSLTNYVISASILSRQDDSVSISSQLQNISALLPGTSVTCGSYYFQSNVWTISHG